MTDSRLAQDLRELVEHTPAAAWQALAGQRLFITGGTGFVGKWLLHALLEANRAKSLGLEMVVLSRDPAAFAARHPQLAASPSLAWHAGDAASFSFPAGHFDGVIHAALPVAPPGTADDGLAALAAASTRRTCEFAAQAGAHRFLHISSGAVYGPQPGDGPIHEDAAWNETAPANAYTLAKRAAERVLQQPWPFEQVVARLFGFIGPYLEAAGGTAAAQFTARAARGEAITVQGTGAALRSYQYAADMARWLLVLYALGRPGSAVNVGGSQVVSVAQLARQVGDAAAPPVPVRIAGGSHTGLAPAGYVPAVQLAAEQLGLRNQVGLDEAILRTLQWLRAQA